MRAHRYLHVSAEYKRRVSLLTAVKRRKNKRARQKVTPDSRQGWPASIDWHTFEERVFTSRRFCYAVGDLRGNLGAVRVPAYSLDQPWVREVDGLELPYDGTRELHQPSPPWWGPTALHLRSVRSDESRV